MDDCIVSGSKEDHRLGIGRYCVSEFIAITLHGQLVGLHGVYYLLHGVNEFSVWSKEASVLLCIARSGRKQFMEL